MVTVQLHAERDPERHEFCKAYDAALFLLGHCRLHELQTLALRELRAIKQDAAERELHGQLPKTVQPTIDQAGNDSGKVAKISYIGGDL